MDARAEQEEWEELAVFRSSQGSRDTYNPAEQVEPQRVNSESLSELDSLDPQKRELLEARLMGRISHLAPSPERSNLSNASSIGEEEAAGSSKMKSRKRAVGDSESKGNYKSPRIDPSRKIDEYFPSKGASGSNMATSFHGNSSVVVTQLQFGRSGTVHTACQTDSGREDEVDIKETQMLREKVEETEQILKESNEKLDAANKKLSKSLQVIKDLLMEKCISDKKHQREESVKNQLRLGRFQTQRQGAQFVETWVDGFQFMEVSQMQTSISQQREELEKQRKLLSRRKVQATVGSGSGGRSRGGKHSPTMDGDFTKPAAPSITYLEYVERDEILKLRIAALKKEDASLQQEMEKLERDRNLHIREMKRITAEDNSRFSNQPTLNNRYFLLQLIGKGGFSEVFKGYDLVEQRYVACKIHQLSSEWKEDKKANYIKHALREYNIHKKLDHPHVVKLFDVFEIDANSFCTVLEFVSGNDLDFLLKQQKMIPEKEARSIIMQTLSALRHLNEIKPPIIHFDLKPGNILLGSGIYSYEAKITDFGLSKIMEQENPDGMELTSQGAGTYWYLPPECFIIGREPPKISSKVDVWSVGVIFYQCLYGRKPFGHNLSQASILEQNTMLRATEVEFPQKPPVSAEAKDFMKKCLTYKKELRPDVLTLCDDPYLKPKKLPTGGSPGPSH